MCNNHLQDAIDFTWISNRTSFALDWGLYCNNENEIATIKSFVFVGGFLGLVSGTAMYDRVGRKITTIAGAMISAAATLGGALTNSVEVMLAVRLAQGFGAFNWAVRVANRVHSNEEENFYKLSVRWVVLVPRNNSAGRSGLLCAGLEERVYFSEHNHGHHINPPFLLP